MVLAQAKRSDVALRVWEARGCHEDLKLKRMAIFEAMLGCISTGVQTLHNRFWGLESGSEYDPYLLFSVVLSFLTR